MKLISIQWLTWMFHKNNNKARVNLSRVNCPAAHVILMQLLFTFSGDFQQTQIWRDEEGV